MSSYNIRVMKLESDKRVVSDGSCSECVRCLRLYLCDADDWGGIILVVLESHSIYRQVLGMYQIYICLENEEYCQH